jgi:hypothetical protein
VFEIGNSLREARLRQQLDFPEIEQATKIRGKYIRALEEEAFDVLPAQTYVKGFLRTYADYLGLDGQLYVDEYNSRYVTGEDELPVARPVRRQPAGGFGRIQARGVVIALAAIAVVTALVIAAPNFGGGHKQAVVGVNAPRGTQPAPRKGPTKAHRVRRRFLPPARLLLAATDGPCWLEVHQGFATGPIRFRGTLEPGKTLPLTARRFFIRIGNPPKLVLKVNGRTLAIPSELAVDVIVTARGLTKAPAGA